MITVFHPDGTVEKIDERKPPLKRLQELVGGYIELLPKHMHNLDHHVLVDEDGLSKGLPPNPKGSQVIGSTILIMGNIVIVELDDLE